MTTSAPGVSAWIAPLPGALSLWRDLAVRGETALLDLRYGGAPAADVAAILPAQAPRGQLGLVLPVGDDARADALRTWARACGTTVVMVVDAAADVEAAPEVHWWWQISDASLLTNVPETVAAVVLAGHEAGGAVGESTSFLLLQQARPNTELPLHVRGGIGPATAAAAVAGGADGVCLDDALLFFPELAIPDAMRAPLARLNGSETRLIGETIDQPWRMYAPPRSAALERLEGTNAEVERGEVDADALPPRMLDLLNWTPDGVWPVGQGVGFASALAATHGRVPRLLAHVRKHVRRSLQAAAEQDALAEGAALAYSQGTRYPLVQGPMTRVSDEPAFAQAVAEGGALPFLALALLRGPQVEAMLAETTQRLGDKPWGVGLLGFIPEALRKEQLAVVAKFNPGFALIAGGRPDQARAFEDKGVQAWLHVPSPALLRLYIEQGARRFIFEGRECGGHIGPLSSFALWEQMVAILSTEVEASTAAEVEVLFAGGISDARSGAMVAALAAPLVERGVKVGALMGTAYLFTQEIVDSGAILPEFRQQAIACTRTRNLLTGPGHATRCADTPFAAEFLRERQRLAREGLSPEALRDALEDLNLGRLRLASKGQERDAEGQLVTRDDAAQRQDGMYMIGQVASLHDRPTTVAELHARVCADSRVVLAERVAALAGDATSDSVAAPLPADVAVVGINVILPQAQDNNTFWGKLVGLEKTITEVPRERWDLDLYFDPDKSARDKIYSRWGGFLDDVVFDPTQYGIAPNSMRSIDPLQLLALESTARALKDTGWGDDFDREHTSIILGAGGGVGELGLQYGVRAEIPRFVENPDEGVWDRLPEWTNESFAGVLLNVAAGRIANRLNFGGVNFVVDAACGSSLAAITLATQELTSGRANVAIAGGVDNVQGPYGFLCFAKTQALSPTGQPRTFDENADGIVISEGVATVVLKRLADAERDGDRIYAVIKGAAGSSDGRALGMTAPLPAGQKRALKRVYAQAGYGPETLGLVEAHGTGTAVGDRAEAETIVSSLREHGAPPANTVVGSAKTLVGHTKCAAGAVGLIKATLALHHRVLPGHFGVNQPIAPFQGEDSPACLLRDPRPWLRGALPRRAAVSAFGFGGTNFHATLEEYPDSVAVLGASNWPQELLLVSGRDREALAAKIEKLAAAIRPESRLRLADLAASLAGQVREGDCAVAAFVTDSLTAAAQTLAGIVAHLRDGAALPAGVQFTAERPSEAPPLAFLFPGQGAQAVGRGREAALYLAPLRDAVERADRVLASTLGRPLSTVMWPPSAYDDATEAAQQAALTDTRFAQPALGALALGYSDWLQSLGVAPAVCAGHSYGEFVALHAAGAMSADEMLTLSAARGNAMAAAADLAPGAMAAVMAPREAVEALIAAGEDVHLANHNTPEQVVVTGTVAGIDALMQRAEAKDVRVRRLPVAGAFHSPLMQPAQPPLSAAIATVDWQDVQRTVYANRDGQPYPTAAADIAAQLDDHLLGPVEFVAQLRAMHEAGIRHFVEVGSRNLLTGMVERTLGDEADCVALDGGAGGLRPALQALAALIVRGVRPQLSGLWAGRAQALGDAALLTALQPVVPPRTAWLLSGGAARPLADPEYKTGKKPALTAADKRAANMRATTAPKEMSMSSQPAPGGSPPPAGVPSAPPAAATASPGMASYPPTTTPAAMPSAPPVASALNVQAFAAYQETMRAFLTLQERALAMALGVPAQAGHPPQGIAGSATQGYVAPPSAMPAPGYAAAPAPAQQAPTAAYAPAPVAPAPAAAAPPSATVPEAAPAAPAAAAAPAPAPTNVSAPAAVDVRSAVLAITADKTGYPEDMLALDADLEADLGIDSIKRVEIVGAIQKQLPEATATAMQAELERYTRAKTLQVLIDSIMALEAAGAAPVATAVESHAAPSAASASAPTAAAVDVGALVVAITADKTGYPEDMLDRAADLEADLGIDSIKRVEIVGAVQKQLPAATAEAMQGELERYTRAKSLDALIAAIEALDSSALPGKSSPDATAAHAATTTAAPAAVVVPRQVMTMQDCPLADPGVELSGRVLIVGADDALTQALMDAAQDHAPQARLEFASVSADYAALLAEDWQAVVYLPALFAEDEAAARALLQDWLLLAQAVVAQPTGALLLTATRLGGDFARSEDGVSHPVVGGLVGGMLCLDQEQPDLRCRAVDFNGHSSAQMAELLLRECHDANPVVEVGYRGAQRQRPVTTLQALADTPAMPPAGEVILATGGARGITLACLEERVRRQPQTTLVLLGRSAPAGNDEPTRDAAQWRAHFIDAVRSGGEKLRPKDIDARVERALAAQEVRDNLRRLQAQGATVDYRAVDARDADAMRALVAELGRAHGRIHGVVHAAGV
ncbi:MAG: beta-ketoacyl synthase N-terminal-like domain-containing protein, partial [Oceanococcaceae bacterium]